MTHLKAHQRSVLKILQTCLAIVTFALGTEGIAGFSYICLMIFVQMIFEFGEIQKFSRLVKTTNIQ